MARDEAIGVLGDAPNALTLTGGRDADHRDLNIAAIHERQQQIGALRRFVEVAVGISGLIGERHVLEHVLRREVHVGRLGVLQRPLEEGVTVLAGRARRRAHHRVDDPDVFRKAHESPCRFRATLTRGYRPFEMEPTPLRFTTSDVVIAADRRGDPRDPPVFFLHGGGQTRHSWGTAAEVVAERGWCTYTLDSRGHGESDWSAEANYSLQDFALDLISIADAVGSNPVIVGASLGGLTSLLAMGGNAPGSAAGWCWSTSSPRWSRPAPTASVRS